MSTYALELRNVQAGYGRIEILHGIDLKLAPGSVCALLGPNGAGKTTLLNAIAGLHGVASGDVLFDGERVNQIGASVLARSGVCTVPQSGGVFPSLTVAENLWMATYRGTTRRDVEQMTFDRFPALAAIRNQQAGLLSGGEQQMLAIARVLVSKPTLLLLDELSAGLAPLIVDELYRHVAELASTGVPVLLVEQFASAALPIADTAAILVNGRLTVTSPDIARETLHQAYLKPDPT